MKCIPLEPVRRGHRRYSKIKNILLDSEFMYCILFIFLLFIIHFLIVLYIKSNNGQRFFHGSFHLK